MNRLTYIFLFLVFSLNSYTQEYFNYWGINQKEFIKSLPADSEYLIFKPDDEPEYSNKIISFFQTMGGSDVSVNILRIKGRPVRDYCFFNNRLYSVTEDWREIPSTDTEKLVNNYNRLFTRLSSEMKDGVTINSYVKEKTKIIIYRKQIDDNRFKVKILFYTNDVFNILLNE